MFVTVWLTDLLTDWLTDSLIDWLTDGQTEGRQMQTIHLQLANMKYKETHNNFQNNNLKYTVSSIIQINE